MNGFAFGFLLVSYIVSLITKDIIYILFSIGFLICSYLDNILKELKK